MLHWNEQSLDEGEFIWQDTPTRVCEEAVAVWPLKAAECA